MEALLPEVTSVGAMFACKPSLRARLSGRVTHMSVMLQGEAGLAGDMSSFPASQRRRWGDVLLKSNPLRGAKIAPNASANLSVLAADNGSQSRKDENIKISKSR